MSKHVHQQHMISNDLSYPLHGLGLHKSSEVILKSYTQVHCNRDHTNKRKLEDLKVLTRLPDLFNNVKIGQGQLQLIIKHFVLPYMEVAAILVK